MNAIFLKVFIIAMFLPEQGNSKLKGVQNISPNLHQ